ncbi:MAG: URC4/urg3 family protein [Cyanobacteria bacterium P01_H01_bin.121]
MTTDLAAVVRYLQSPQAIRDRCDQIFQLAVADKTPHFRYSPEQLEPTANYVLQVIEHHYPAGNIPFHSRWRHFEVGTGDRLTQLTQKLQAFEPREQARIKFDLVIISVLLDAGAGAQWRYLEPHTDAVWRRSEGLAIASFWSFWQGVFALDPQQLLQVDARRLQSLTLAELAEAFQATPQNPLVGLEGRLHLLQKLGQVMLDQPEVFACGSGAIRPGGMVDYLLAQSQNQQLAATTVLQTVLQCLGAIWPGRASLATTNLGDVWHYPHLPEHDPGSQLVPFHKLSQWLTYSLLEPLQALGLTITDLDQLTGLAEYRNGGLCLDLGLLAPKNPDILQRSHRPNSDIVVEWRALTLICLDRIAESIRKQLGETAQTLPLVKILQGGTWTAGRQLAQEHRLGGGPPLQIESDGTVF